MKNYSHGGDIYSYKEKYGKIPKDFSINVNPLPLPSSVKEAYIKAFDKASVYPDHSSASLVKALARYENIPEDTIFCGGGASEIIYRIFYGLKPWKTIIPAPSFSEYAKAAEMSGSKVTYRYLNEAKGFYLAESILEDIEENCLVFLCNPNNPTGRIINAPLMDKIAAKCYEKGCILVVDECFADFCPGLVSCKKYLKDYDNIIILKAFTKFFGLAGLRLGYCISLSRSYLEKIEAAGQSWAVSATAAACGEAVLKEKSYFDKSIGVIQEEKKFLLREFTGLPVEIYGQAANFIFFRSEDLFLKEKLEKRGILIRDCRDFKGLRPGFYRIGVKLREDNVILAEALKNAISG